MANQEQFVSMDPAMQNASQEVPASHLGGNQINPNSGPMRIDGEIVFRSELDEMMQKLPFNTDSYKPSMDPQYPPDVETVHSYVESRGNTEYPDDLMVFAGSQPWINQVAEGVNMREVNLAREMWAAHGVPFPYEMWKTVVKDYGGRIPLHIRAIPEGTVLPSRNVLATVENIGGKPTRGLTTWAETTYLSSIWYMSSVATESWHIKQLISKYYDKSVTDGREDPSLMFRLHDFGFRGVAPGAAGAGGAAHLLNFMGTDTYSSIPFLVKNYMADPALVGYSIPAMEHSTVTSWGRENEFSAYDNMTKLYAGEGKLYAMVIDSYDPIQAVEYITKPDWTIVKTLKERGGLCVLRPDSGDPLVLLPQLLKIVAKNVGYTTNKKGYKILNHFRFIWGDGINRLTIDSILRTVVDVMGFSAENFAFGMGGALLQVTNRDKLQFAMKCSAVRLTDGTWRNVYKQPAGVISKNSKQGLVETFVVDSDDWSVDDAPIYVRDIRDKEAISRLSLRSLLEDVFVGGSVLKRWSLSEARANTQWPLLNAEQGHSAGVYAPLI